MTNRERSVAAASATIVIGLTFSALLFIWATTWSNHTLLVVIFAMILLGIFAGWVKGAIRGVN